MSSTRDGANTDDRACIRKEDEEMTRIVVRKLAHPPTKLESLFTQLNCIATNARTGYT